MLSVTDSLVNMTCHLWSAWHHEFQLRSECFRYWGWTGLWNLPMHKKLFHLKPLRFKEVQIFHMTVLWSSDNEVDSVVMHGFIWMGMQIARITNAAQQKTRGAVIEYHDLSLSSEAIHSERYITYISTTLPPPPPKHNWWWGQLSKTGKRQSYAMGAYGGVGV
jgi:hypothetical protein